MDKELILLLVVSCCLASAGAGSLYFKEHAHTGHIDKPIISKTVHYHASDLEADQAWGYATVRPKANIFFWLYQTTHASGYQKRPLILWLQGGPGASGTGYGNFEEIGPLDVGLKPRNTTWLQTASLLFIDSPVGTGYSYAEDDSAYTTNVSQISTDLLAVMQGFLKIFPNFTEVPFYIFSESYGGKMTADFSAVLFNAIKQGQIKMNFKGLAMGDSWISPVDSTNSWGPYLYATSIVDLRGLNEINNAARKIEQLVKQGRYTDATDAWSQAEYVVESVSAGVNFYNILDWGGSSARLSRSKQFESKTYIEQLYERHVKVMAEDDLDTLMNGPIRKQLEIIPDNVVWGGQSNMVFSKQSEDFMKNVTSTVNQLINETPLKVIVYSGQLDLICDVLGTEQWFNTLDIADKFNKASRQDFSCRDHPDVCYYVKEVDNVQFYWILESGHMVPSDNGPGALDMVNRIIN